LARVPLTYLPGLLLGVVAGVQGSRRSLTVGAGSVVHTLEEVSIPERLPGLLPHIPGAEATMGAAVATTSTATLPRGCLVWWRLPVPLRAFMQCQGAALLGPLLAWHAEPPWAAPLLELLHTNLWVGSANKTSVLHFDDYENLLVQVLPCAGCGHGCSVCRRCRRRSLATS
jgi:hypothetical protein